MPLKKSGSPEAFKQNLKTEMKHGKPQKQALAIAYSTKRAAMQKKAKGGKVRNCPVCGLQGSQCDCGDIQKMAEGGMVDSEKPLKSQPVASNPEYAEGMDDTERSEFGYGESSQTASALERDMPQRSVDLSLSDDIMLDRKRRGMQRTQPMDNDSRVSSKESGLDNNDSNRDKLSDSPVHGHVPHQDRPKRSMPRVSDEDLSERNDSDVLHMSMGGEVDEQAQMNQSSKVGSLQAAIDAPDRSNLSNNADEIDPDPEDGRESRGLNLEPVHEMTDPEHDQESASKDSDYEDHDDSLVGEILRERRRNRRGL